MIAHDDCVDLAHRLNAGCQCTSLDSQRLERELEVVSPGFHDAVVKDRPHLFSGSVVYVGEADLQAMAELVQAIDRVVAHPAYQEHVLAWAPPLARASAAPGAPGGVFLGYDFHIGDPATRTPPQLIEINTNAGGALLNALLARAQYACCDEVSAHLTGELVGDTPEHLFLEMFKAEWARGGEKVRRLASADFSAATQFQFQRYLVALAIHPLGRVEAQAFGGGIAGLEHRHRGFAACPGQLQQAFVGNHFLGTQLQVEHAVEVGALEGIHFRRPEFPWRAEDAGQARHHASRRAFLQLARIGSAETLLQGGQFGAAETL